MWKRKTEKYKLLNQTEMKFEKNLKEKSLKNLLSLSWQIFQQGLK